jgi:hypothetical protein
MWSTWLLLVGVVVVVKTLALALAAAVEAVDCLLVLLA